jgi:hypothetical protein
MKVLDRLVGLR